MTPIGSEFFNPEFGSNLHLLAFEPNDDILQAQGRIYTVEALERWEPRISIIGCDITADDHELKIEITYTIIPLQDTDTTELTVQREEA
jgi:hypothetical protein